MGNRAPAATHVQVSPSEVAQESNTVKVTHKPNQSELVGSTAAFAACPVEDLSALKAKQATAKKKEKLPVMTPSAFAAKAKASKSTTSGPKGPTSKVEATSRAAAPLQSASEESSETVQQAPAEGKQAHDDPIPRGEVGAEWEALEDAVVREGLDVKSTRLGGVIQEGERCVQTGPWKGHPSGCVRMPVRGPRGLSGWVTLDSTRCKFADGSMGTRCFALAPPAPAPEPEESEEEDVDDECEEEMHLEEEPETQLYDDKQYEETPGNASVPAATSTRAREESELTPAQRSLRNLRKKLRDVEALEKRLADVVAITAEQQSKLANASQIRESIITAEAQVAAEKKSATGARRRRKPAQSKQKGASKAVAKGTAQSSKTSPCVLIGRFTVLLLPLAGATYYYFAF